MIAAKRITSLLCAGVLAATTLGVTVQAAPDRRAHVGRNSRLNPAPTPVRGRDVPGLIADPDNLRHLVEIDDDFRNGTCSFHVTFNGGKTWKGGNVKAPEGFTKPVCSGLDSLGRPHINGTAAFGSKNNVYMAFSSIREGDALDSVLVAKSTDGGRSFETAVVAIPSTADPALGYVLPGIAVSPRKGGQDLVHVVANSVIPPAQPGRRSRLKDLVSVTSTNGGESFSAPVMANAPADKTRSEHSQPYVGPDGTIYFVYRVAIDPGFTGRAMLRLGVSKDAGQTWTQENVATVVGLTYPRMTVDPRDGTLYAAFEELREDRKFDAFIRSSTDGGKTWSERVRVNDDPENNDVQNQMPWVSTGPNGRVDVVCTTGATPIPAPSHPVTSAPMSFSKMSTTPTQPTRERPSRKTGASPTEP